MHRLELSRHALRAMRRIPQDRTRQIFDALEELLPMSDPTTHPNLKAMKGDWRGCWRMRIGSYRAVLAINPDPKAESGEKVMLVLVEAVGPRGDIYKG